MATNPSRGSPVPTVRGSTSWHFGTSLTIALSCYYGLEDVAYIRIVIRSTAIERFGVMAPTEEHRINVVLVAPEIPQNTGNIIRLCANAGAALHLVEPLGFKLTQPGLKRAALDYIDLAQVAVHSRFDEILEIVDESRLYAATTEGTVPYHEIRYQPGDTVVFGSEQHGLNDHVLAKIIPANRIRIPMKPSNRSMNLSNAVAVIVYEMWRQIGFDDQSITGSSIEYFS